MLTSETTSATGGRKFYAEQIELLGQRRTDELIDKHYHGEAVFVSFGKVVRGAQNLKQYFRDYVKMLGKLDLLSLDQFTETEDAIFFEATIRSSLGEARVYDAFVLRDGKATHHFAGLK